MSAVSFSTLPINPVSVSNIHYPLPVLSRGVKRKIFETGRLLDGQKYSIVGLNPLDAPACHALCEAEYDLAAQTGKSYLLRRSVEEISHMMDFDRTTRQGGIVLGAVLNGNRLGAVGAIDLVDDEKDAGRGAIYDADGACPLERQIYFKMATAHPSLRSQNLNLPKMLYPYRLAVGLWFEERECFLTKVSGASTKKFYANNGWEIVDQYRLPEADDPAFDLTEEEKVLNTYLLSRDQALNNLQVKYPHVHEHLKDLQTAFKDFTDYKNTTSTNTAKKLFLT